MSAPWPSESTILYNVHVSSSFTVCSWVSNQHGIKTKSTRGGFCCLAFEECVQKFYIWPEVKLLILFLHLNIEFELLFGKYATAVNSPFRFFHAIVKYVVPSAVQEHPKCALWRHIHIMINSTWFLIAILLLFRWWLWTRQWARSTLSNFTAVFKVCPKGCQQPD